METIGSEPFVVREDESAEKIDIGKKNCDKKKIVSNQSALYSFIANGVFLDDSAKSSDRKLADATFRQTLQQRLASWKVRCDQRRLVPHVDPSKTSGVLKNKF